MFTYKIETTVLKGSYPNIIFGALSLRYKSPKINDHVNFRRIIRCYCVLLFSKIKRIQYRFNRNEARNRKQLKIKLWHNTAVSWNKPCPCGCGHGWRSRRTGLFWSCCSTENILGQQWPVVNNIYSGGKTSRWIKKQSSSTIYNSRRRNRCNLIWNIWGLDCRHWVYSYGCWILKALVYISNYDKVLGVHNGHICPMEVEQSNSSRSLSSSALFQLTATCLPSVCVH